MKRIIMKNNKLMFDSNLYFDNNNNSSKDIDNYNNDNESSSLCPMFIRRSSSLSLSASFRLQLHLDWYLNTISQFFQPALYSSIHSPNNNNNIKSNNNINSNNNGDNLIIYATFNQYASSSASCYNINNKKHNNKFFNNNNNLIGFQLSIIILQFQRFFNYYFI